MKNFETHYTTNGSSALKTVVDDNIIEFPGHNPYEASCETEDVQYFSNIRQKILSNKRVQELKNGTIQGKAFNAAKPWQSVLMGSTFFAFAVACIFFGY